MANNTLLFLNQDNVPTARLQEVAPDTYGYVELPEALIQQPTIDYLMRKYNLTRDEAEAAAFYANLQHIANTGDTSTLPEGYTVNTLPIQTGYGGMEWRTVVFDPNGKEVARPTNVKYNTQDPSENFLNDAMFLAGGASRAVANGAWQMTRPMLERSVQDYLEPALRPSGWLERGLPQFGVNPSTAARIGKYADVGVFGTLGGLALNNFIQDPNLETGADAALMVGLPIVGETYRNFRTISDSARKSWNWLSNKNRAYRLSTAMDRTLKDTNFTGTFPHTQTQSSHIIENYIPSRNNYTLNIRPNKLTLTSFMPRTSKLSTAERVGIPRGDRNQNQSWTNNFMGVVERVPLRRWLREQTPSPGHLFPSEDNVLFGNFLGNGMEQTAFLSGYSTIPTALKIPAASYFNNKPLNFPDLESIRVYNQQALAIHNQVPNVLRQRIVGYTWSPEQTINGVTYPPSFHPVYEQGVALPIKRLPYSQSSQYEHDIRQNLSDKGWNVMSNYTTVRKGNLEIKDLHDGNVGVDLNGQTVIMDPGFDFSQPWKFGTETSFPNRFNLKASDLNFSGKEPLKSTDIDHDFYDKLMDQIKGIVKPTIQSSPTIQFNNKLQL